MSATSKIEWTDRTWNPTRGCSIVSPGCVNCYAMKQAHRFSGVKQLPHGGVKAGPYFELTKLTKAGPQWTGKVRTVEDALLEPLSWRKPQRVFVNSMSDLFHEDVPDEFIDRVFAVMALASQHTFQILTKRPDRMRTYISAMYDREVEVSLAITRTPWWDGPQSSPCAVGAIEDLIAKGPLPNVWLGVSVEDQKHADERIPLLLQTPAAVRFISAEPLLGPVDLTTIPIPNSGTGQEWDPIKTMNVLRRASVFAPHLDWVIVGGESGPGARPFDLAWVRAIVQQCKAAGVPAFFKQAGSVPMIRHEEWEGNGERVLLLNARNHHRVPRSHVPLKFHDKKGGTPEEWPEPFPREFPAEGRG